MSDSATDLVQVVGGSEANQTCHDEGPLMLERSKTVDEDQAMWLKELESYNQFPPLQDPASYTLTQVMEQVVKARANGD